jgi:hypothetical protein
MAQRAAATGGLERLVEMLGKMVAAFPTVGDLFDADEALREYNDLLANPQKLLRGPEQVKAIRAQRQQQQAAQQRLALIAKGGPAAVQAAQTLSQTQLGTGSALDAVLSGVGGQPSQASQG